VIYRAYVLGYFPDLLAMSSGLLVVLVETMWREIKLRKIGNIVLSA